MIFDMADSPLVGELIVFPGYPFAAEPLHTPIMETISIGGSTTGTSQTSCGTADHQEGQC